VTKEKKARERKKNHTTTEKKSGAANSIRKKGDTLQSVKNGDPILLQDG